MRNKSFEPTPDETKVEQLLSSFQPKPSPRYYSRMSSSPWLKQDVAQYSVAANKRLPRWVPAVAFASVILALALLSLSFIPSVRAAASQIIHFFLPSTTEQIKVQVTPDSSLVSLDFLNPSNYPLDLTSAQQQSGFIVKQIPSSPDAPSFIGARYAPNYNEVILLYQGSGYSLLVTQRPLGNSQDVFSIGPNAQIEYVTVGNIRAEYVVGGWSAVSTQALSSTITPSGTLELNAVWDDTLPQYTLRWQQADTSYELRCHGINCPSQSQLISLANELK